MLIITLSFKIEIKLSSLSSTLIHKVSYKENQT